MGVDPLGTRDDVIVGENEPIRRELCAEVGDGVNR
jgi:hypothetical protein